jgi:selenocysteine lyase/cysteine desulfurase
MVDVYKDTRFCGGRYSASSTAQLSPHSVAGPARSLGASPHYWNTESHVDDTVRALRGTLVQESTAYL